MRTPCPVCLEPVLDLTERCKGCDTPCHRRCSVSTGGCLVPGCPAGAFLIAAPESVPHEPRSTLGRAWFAFRESVRAAPYLVPLMLVAWGLPMLLVTWLGGMGSHQVVFRAAWFVGLLGPLVVWPAVVLLMMDEGARHGGLAALVRRVVSVWPRWIPALLAFSALAIPVSLSPLMVMTLLGHGAIYPAMLAANVAIGALVAAVGLAAAVACQDRAREPRWPIARALELARRAPVAAAMTGVLAVAAPWAATQVVQALIVKHGVHVWTYGWAWSASYSLLLAFAGQVWPLAYAALTYRDLAASRAEPHDREPADAFQR